MLFYKDFVPKRLGEAGFLGEPEFETLQEAAEGAKDWLAKSDVRVVNVETVVLPNLHHPHESGSEDVNIRQDGDWQTPWNQFIRVWYDEG